MKFLRLAFYVLIAQLVLSGCAGEAVEETSSSSSSEINFDAYLGRNASTRSEVTDNTHLKGTEGNSGFGVFARYKHTDGTISPLMLMNNEHVYWKNWKGDHSDWGYENTRYWPNEGSVDFYAFAPHSAEPKLVSPKDNGNFAIEEPNSTCIYFPSNMSPVDLVWANAKNQTKANNSGAKKVEFTFNHALAKIGYKVKLKDDYKNVTIKLKKITLAGSTTEPTKKAFYTKGTIDLSKTSSDAELWTKPTSAEKQNFDWFSGDKSVTSTSESNPDTDYLFVIPQDFSNTDELYVIVEYTIQNGSTETMTSTVSSKLTKNFLQGKAYTINLTIGLTPIEFNADVTGWVDDNTIPEIPLN